MQTGSPFSLIDDMLAAPALIKNFDPDRFSGWHREISRSKKLFITGEGSSRIFPAKNTIDQALHRNIGWQITTQGARQAAEYDLESYTVLGLSNSGYTRELISLFQESPGFSVTAAANTPLESLAKNSFILSCGAEKAVAASKSVIEQALVCQALLQGAEWQNQAKAAEACTRVLAQDPASSLVDALASADHVYIAGRNDGVAEELVLKTNEIIRKKASFLEGTYVLHGIEEVMQPGEAILLIDPFMAEIERYQAVLGRAGVNVIAIASYETPFPTLRIPMLDRFDGYIRLMAGWTLLVSAGLALGINIDKPARARKIGNAV